MTFSAEFVEQFVASLKIKHEIQIKNIARVKKMFDEKNKRSFTKLIKRIMDMHDERWASNKSTQFALYRL